MTQNVHIVHGMIQLVLNVTTNFVKSDWEMKLLSASLHFFVYLVKFVCSLAPQTGNIDETGDSTRKKINVT